MAEDQERIKAKPEATTIIRSLLVNMQPRREGDSIVDSYAGIRLTLSQEHAAQKRMMQQGVSLDERYDHLQQTLARARAASPYY